MNAFVYRTINYGKPFFFFFLCLPVVMRSLLKIGRARVGTVLIFRKSLSFYATFVFYILCPVAAGL